MNTISRSYTFSAAHRIEGHPKCGRMHGHNYRVEVSITGEYASDGMLLDYGKLDEIVKPMIETFDHRYIISQSNILAEDPYINVAIQRHDAVLAPDIRASTAECLSEMFAKDIQRRIIERYGEDLINSITIDVQETDKSHASYLLHKGLVRW